MFISRRYESCNDRQDLERINSRRGAQSTDTPGCESLCMPRLQGYQGYTIIPIFARNRGEN